MKYKSKTGTIVKIVISSIVAAFALMILGAIIITGSFFDEISLVLGFPALIATPISIVVLTKGIKEIGEINRYNAKLDKEYREKKQEEAKKNGAELVWDGSVTNILWLYEDRLVLTSRKGVRSYLAGSYFNGEKELYYSDLTSLQFREATRITNGYIQFDFPGSVNTSTNRVGGGNSYNSENTFVFNVPIEETASNLDGKLEALNKKGREACDYIRSKMKACKILITQPAVSTPIEDLKKYKDLCDAGVITQEEFEAKKKQLLDI